MIAIKFSLNADFFLKIGWTGWIMVLMFLKLFLMEVITTSEPYCSRIEVKKESRAYISAT